MRDPNNPWHPWQLRPAGHGHEILRHDGWMVWGDVPRDASDADIEAAIERANERRAEWLNRTR